MSDFDDLTATHAELAEWTGLSARGVAEAGKRGVMVKAGRQFRLKESVQRYIADLQRQLRQAGGAGVAASAAAERGRLAKEQADALALKNAR
jgi:phage terminase Nu1 subunit (DNA packaging protein)